MPLEDGTRALQAGVKALQYSAPIEIASNFKLFETTPFSLPGKRRLAWRKNV
jgi:hypothetical protein